MKTLREKITKILYELLYEADLDDEYAHKVTDAILKAVKGALPKKLSNDINGFPYGITETSYNQALSDIKKLLEEKA
jgi:hypothetical protein